MLDNTQIQKLLSLSDEELRRKLSKAAIDAGADKFMTASALSDMQKLRGMISGLTNEQIKAIISRADPDTAAKISKYLSDI